MEGCFDVAGHGYADCAIGVVPFKGQTKVFGPCHVNGYCVPVTYWVEEMVKVVLVNVLYAEVVDDQRDVASAVLPEGQGAGNWGVSVLG